MREDFKGLEGELPKKEAEYETIVESLEKIRHPLSYSWGVVSHLNNVKNSDELRKVHQAVQPEVVKASMELSQSRVVFNALGSLDQSALPESRKRIVESALRDMRLSGVDLEDSICAVVCFGFCEWSLENLLAAFRAAQRKSSTPYTWVALPPCVCVRGVLFHQDDGFAPLGAWCSNGLFTANEAD
ncbi:CYOP [Symbiodinium pilosum]|uniref:CYOP protein n=1 Tax=Symbiodinium pilosum TaxID=2952 RepID=A0A812XDU4_SYMPI|nr:CYOP [Symbiodinium pilosum]